MQWNKESHAGFTAGTPWIKINPNFERINAAEVVAEKDSIYHFYKDFLSFRKENRTFVYGSYKELDYGSENLFVYERKDDEALFVIVLNHSNIHEELQMDMTSYSLIKTNLDNKMDQVLLPWEARLYRKQ